MTSVAHWYARLPPAGREQVIRDLVSALDRLDLGLRISRELWQAGKSACAVGHVEEGGVVVKSVALALFVENADHGMLRALRDRLAAPGSLAFKVGHGAIDGAKKLVLVASLGVARLVVREIDGHLTFHVAALAAGDSGG